MTRSVSEWDKEQLTMQNDISLSSVSVSIIRTARSAVETMESNFSGGIVRDNSVSKGWQMQMATPPSTLWSDAKGRETFDYSPFDALELALFFPLHALDIHRNFLKGPNSINEQEIFSNLSLLTRAYERAHENFFLMFLWAFLSCQDQMNENLMRLWIWFSPARERSAVIFASTESFFDGRFSGNFIVMTGSRLSRVIGFETIANLIMSFNQIWQTLFESTKRKFLSCEN